MNECTYLGRICTDLVLNKKAMDDKENYWTRFRLAVARKRVKKEGEKDTDFFNCVAFGSAAKGICTYAKKGGRICVCGENRENNFEKDGMKYYTVELFIKDYHVIDFKEKKQASGDVTEEAPFPPEYSYIKKGIFLNITMEDLPEKKKQHKKKKVKVQKRVQAGDSISQRPEHIDFREEFGHWEMDTVVGPQGKSKKVMLVLTERKTRKEIVYLMPDRKAQTVVKTLNMIERKCGERLFRDVFKTITVDNGVEFSDAEGLEKSRRNKKKRTKVYYCHPYSSCERGSNENANRLIRRHIPKGVNFDKKSKTEIKEIETWINNYPRKIFEYDTAENQFINEMEKLTG